MAKLLCCALLAALAVANGFHVHGQDNEITGLMRESEICSLPKVVGPCNAHIPRWYFNEQSGVCERFIYGGCQGNENNFGSKRACEQRCQQTHSSVEEAIPEMCTLPKVEGPCNAHIPRWFFNKDTSKCEEFIYGGCQGNGNNFETKRACEQRCSWPDVAPVEEALPYICTLPKKVGPCRSAIPRWFYNKESRVCQVFVYGGCEANDNNFETKLACEQRCEYPRVAPVQEALPFICTLPKKVGPCKASIPRWFYNKESRKCQEFVYGGCEANENNFETKLACEQRCEYPRVAPVQEALSSICTLPQKVGPCKASIPRWFYNKDSRKCQEFVYGGCEGNENNFESEMACEQRCSWPRVAPVQEALPFICTLPKKVGPCKASIPRWFYNKESRVCEEFVYGGCEANENNFETKRACEKSCTWPRVASVEEAIPEMCTLPKSKGPCKAHIPRWFFNKDTSQCEQFVYGGCRGNENNFETKRACEQRCSWPDVAPVEEGQVEESHIHGESNEISTSEEEQNVQKWFKCPGNGLFSNPRNCSSFIQCSNGIPQMMPCPKGLDFSYKTKRCEQPCDAFCNRTLSCKCEWKTCGLPRECSFEPVTGPCHASIPRYYFDKQSGECKHFLYGGCKGNKNNFQTKEACEKRCSKSEHSENEEISIADELFEIKFRCPKDGLFPNPQNCSTFVQCSNGIPYVMPCPAGLHYSVELERCERQCDAYCNHTLSCECKWPTCGLIETCFLPKETGPCYASIQRYFFNKRTGQCEQFIYGGCKGNQNNFATKEACEKRCTKATGTCALPKETGPCKARIERYFYNSQIGHCEKFIYGGCRGNANNFQTKVQCESSCINEIPAVCLLPKVVGPGRAHLPRYYFNKESGVCEQFVYGGVQGNENNFEKIEECEQKCTNGVPSVCLLPKEIGTGRANVPRYYFNKESGKCEKFFFGGSNGNENNFMKIEECERKCIKSTSYTQAQRIPSFCLLPKKVGPGRATLPRFYFNKETHNCDRFVYGGVQGNANNFETIEECERKCSDTEQSMSESSEIPTTSEEEEADFWFQCPFKSGLYPNPRNCSTFVQCSNGKPYVMPCPKGLHFSVETQKCEEQCDAYCNRTLSCKCEWKTCGLPRECFLSKETGPCRANVPRWYFNKRSGECEKFTYGGCKGNKNNFETKEACEKRCSKSSHTEDDEISTADEQVEFRYKCIQDGLFPNPRNCSTFVQCSNGKPYVMPCPKGLHYSVETKQCEQKCEAYCNRTLSCECRWPTCGLHRTCFLPKWTGPCQASIERYFFNKRTGQCEKFIYGGCKGNSNNFETKEACEKRCSHSATPEEDISVADEELETSFKCHKDGLYQNYRNCSSFIQCSNGNPHVMPCPKGLHYSVKTKRCEEPCKAFCNSTLSCKCKWPTCGLPEVCFLPAKTGPCRAGFQRYFFNKRTGKCEKFVYGGCRGNSNNFETKEACQKYCKKIQDDQSSVESSHEEFSASEEQQDAKPWFRCTEDGVYKYPRNCSSFVQCSNGKPYVMPCPKGLHFSEETKRCERQCEAYCNRTLSCTCKWPTCGLNRVCFFEKEVGNCRGSLPRWFFNKRTGHCEQFTYSGCQGNQNNFPTKEGCEQRCSRSGHSEDEEISIADEQMESRFSCLQDGLFPNPRNCSTFVQCSNGKPYVMPCPKGLHFSEETQKCEEQCDAYCNRTLSCKCKWSTCGLSQTCFYPKRVGPCLATIPRYFFNKRTGQCEKFIYGGCKGNSNNFETKEACEKRCSKKSEDEQEEQEETQSAFVNVCRLDMDQGPCSAYLDRFYFDYRSGECKKFVYGGCGGNGNNFRSLKVCETRCLMLQQSETVSSESSEEEHAHYCPMEDGEFPHPHSCDKFIRCTDSIPQVYRCPPSTSFSESRRACVPECIRVQCLDE